MLQYLTKLRKKRGFTLVELIIVLVILAILAAVAIPALTGYIDKAREKKYMLMAKNVMKAAQIEFSELYAEGASLVPEWNSWDWGGGWCYCIPALNNAETNEWDQNAASEFAQDAYIQDSDLCKEIFKTAGIEDDEKPNFLAVGLGNSRYYMSNADESKKDPHRAYKVYFILYWQDYDDPNSAIFYDGSEWTSTYPWSKDDGGNFENSQINLFEIEGESEPVYIQFYIMNQSDDYDKAYGTVWNFMSEKCS